MIIDLNNSHRSMILISMKFKKKTKKKKKMNIYDQFFALC